MTLCCPFARSVDGHPLPIDELTGRKKGFKNVVNMQESELLRDGSPNPVWA